MRRKLESEVKDLRARVADLKEQMQSDSIASNLREDMAKQSYQVSGIGVVQVQRISHVMAWVLLAVGLRRNCVPCISTTRSCFQRIPSKLKP